MTKSPFEVGHKFDVSLILPLNEKIGLRPVGRWQGGKGHLGSHLGSFTNFLRSLASLSVMAVHFGPEEPLGHLQRKLEQDGHKPTFTVRALLLESHPSPLVFLRRDSFHGTFSSVDERCGKQIKKKYTDTNSWFDRSIFNFVIF